MLRSIPQFEIHRPPGGTQHLLRICNFPLTWSDATRWIEIPVGFTFDGASVPNVLYPVLDCTALDLIVPGALHDYAYRDNAKQVHIASDVVLPIDRLAADILFKEAADAVGIGYFDQLKLYYGVRVGGASSFDQKPVEWNSWDQVD